MNEVFSVPHMTNADLARRYVALVENPSSTFDEIRALMHDDLSWREMPNRFAPNGRTSSLAGASASWQKGRDAVREQVYDIRRVTAEGDTVVVEVAWRGTIAKELGPFAAGTALAADVALVLTFKDGKIISQTDYPCYHPIAS